MIVYISGPVTGDPNYRARFSAAANKLTLDGHTPLNPAMLPSDLGYAAAMEIDLAMVNACDAIYLLKGYEHSKGALRELSRAMVLEKGIMYE